MAGFDPDQRFFLDVRTMFAVVRIAYPGAGRVFSVLVADSSGKHEHFLAAEMRVHFVTRARRPFIERHHFGLVVIKRHHADTELARQPVAAKIDDLPVALDGTFLQ